MGGIIMIEWLEQNLELVLGGTAITTFISYISYTFMSKVLPKFLEQLQKTFVVVLSNLFGVNYGEGVDMVEKLPAISKLDDLAAEIKLNNQLKLIELKKQLTSPLYTELEKVNIERLYDLLFAMLKEDLPAEFKEVLDQLDNIEVGE